MGQQAGLLSCTMHQLFLLSCWSCFWWPIENTTKNTNTLQLYCSGHPHEGWMGRLRRLLPPSRMHNCERAEIWRELCLSIQVIVFAQFNNTISMTNLVVQPWALGSWKALIFLSGGLGKFIETVSLEPTVAIGWYRRENISKADRYFSILPQNGSAKITPFLNTWKVNPEEFLGVRLLQIIEGCSSKASGESAAILATVGSLIIIIKKKNHQ